MRVVFDTNILIRALIKKDKPKILFNDVASGKIQLVLSEPILEEFIRVTKKEKLQPYFTDKEVLDFIPLLERVSKFVEVESKVDVTRDKSDNAILATALDGNTDFVVSGDNDLLTVREYKGIKIMTVSQMLKILKGRGK